MLLNLIFLIALLGSQTANAAVRTWDGGGTTNNWSEAANWSQDTVPGPGDNARFDGTSTKDAVIDVNLSIGFFDAFAGYTGTITLADGISLTAAGVDFRSGTFAGGAGVLDVNGSFTISGGTFNAPSGQMFLASFFTHTAGGTFNANGGAVIFDGTTNTILVTSTETFNDLVFKSSATADLTGDTLVAEGEVRLMTGHIISGTVEARGNVVVDPTFGNARSSGAILHIVQSATRTITIPPGTRIPTIRLESANVTVQLEGSGAVRAEGVDLRSGTIRQGNADLLEEGVSTFTQSGGNYFSEAGDIVFQNFTQSGGEFFGGAGHLDILNSFTLSGGTFHAVQGTTSVGAFFTHTAGGTLDANGGTWSFDGNQATVFATSPETFFNLTIDTVSDVNLTGDTLVAEGEVRLVRGRVQSGTIRATANVVVEPTFASAHNSGGILHIVQTDTRTIQLPPGTFLPGLLLEAPSVTVVSTGPGAIRFNGIELRSGTIEQGEADFLQSGITSTFLQSGGTYDTGTGDFDFFVFTKSSGDFLGGPGSITVGSTFTLGGGLFRSSQSTASFGSNFTQSGGTFDHNGGLVIFNGNSQVVDVPSTIDFNDVRHQATSVITIANGDTVFVNGDLELVTGGYNTGSTSGFSARGNVTLAATYNSGNGRLTYSGSGPQTYTNLGGVHPFGTVTINKPSGVLTAATDMLLDPTQQLAITSGTLFLAEGSDLRSGAVTIGPAGKLASDSAATITFGGTLTNNGVVDLQGSGSGCPEADTILLRSTIDGTRRNWSGSGVFRIADVDVKDMGGTSPTTPPITVFSGTNSGNNNANWVFDPTCPPELVISPLNVDLTSGGQQQFTVNGGIPPYTFSIPVNNSGAGVNSSTGLYTAGNTAGVSDTVRVTDTLGTFADATVNVVSGPPSKLVFTTHPASRTAGLILVPAITVEVRDSADRRVPNAADQISLTFQTNPSGGILQGTVTKNAVGGVATFDNLRIDQAGSGYRLRASANGLTEAISNNFDIVPGPAVKIGFIAQPSTVAAFEEVAPPFRVAVQDSLGNVVPTASDTITISPFNCVMVGTATRPTVAGVAEFQGISFQCVNSTARIKATSAQGRPFADSQFFEITRPEIVVTNTNSEGPGSLDAALFGAGRLPGGDRVVFNIGGPPPYVIRPVPTRNFTLQGGVDLDATTQPGYAGIPLVTIEGFGASGSGIGLDVWGDSTIRGLAITSWATGIRVYAGRAVIRGNHVGTDTSGTVSAGNRVGIELRGAGSIVGGTGAGDGNLISGNSDFGIFAPPAFTDPVTTVIKGNKIGTDISGTQPLPNGSGIRIEQRQMFEIGGREPGAGNLIAFNTFRGIELPSTQSSTLFPDTERIEIAGNSLHSNGALGIDIGATGINANDPGDLDGGPNTLPNFPRITTAITDRGVLRVSGTLNSRPSGIFELDFYSGAACDESEFGEGANYLGTLNVVTDTGGLASFTGALPDVPAGQFLTVTSTDIVGPRRSTSEFSRCRPVAERIVEISGRLAEANGNPVGGTVLTITEFPSTRQRQVTTDRLGNYSFKGLTGGTIYIVVPNTPNHVHQPGSRIYDPIATDQVNQDYTLMRIRFTVSGRVSVGGVANGTALHGARVELLAGQTVIRSATSAPSGSYIFTDIFPGDYTLRISKDNYQFTPSSVPITISDDDATVNFSGNEVIPTLGGRIVFNEGTAIRAVNPDGSALATLVAALDSGSDASLDGTRIVFVASSISGRSGSLIVAGSDGSSPRSLVDVSVLRKVNPVFSKDGTRIAFLRDNTINIINTDGTGLTEIPFPENNLITSVDFSPDGTKLVFARQWKLFIVNSDGSGLQPLPVTEFANYPRWSPDGSKIVFWNGLLRSIDPDGTNLVTLGSATPSNERPAWSPDSSRIVFHRTGATAQDPKQIVTISRDGTNISVVTDRPRAGNLAWTNAPSQTTEPAASATNTIGGVSVTFSEVTLPGSTSVIPIDPGSAGAAPQGFVLANKAYSITTTAGFTPPVDVCIEVPESTASSQAVFDSVAVLHEENGTLVDRTSARDFQTRTVCGSAASLGAFVLAYAVDANAPSITGLVIDADGNPLSGVSMRLTGTEERALETDIDGRFEFVNLAEGANYSLQPKRLGYVFEEYSLDFLEVTGESTAVFTGTESSFGISGRVTDSSGKGVENATVEVTGSSDELVNTDASGNYAVNGLPGDGSYTVLAFKELFSFTPERFRIDALLSDVSPLDFTERPTVIPAVISGRVTTLDGEAVPYAAITILGSDGEINILTNPFGRFYFGRAVTGESYLISVRSGRYEIIPESQVVTVTSDLQEMSFVAIPR
ncbi:MAG: carboxypeptidase regulatory-like domain-containing protein [Aridibacter famidurans]|nr:carboxypeptidase regulatory-like domain-containing protein [Aridibacter famidurans]